MLVHLTLPQRSLRLSSYFYSFFFILLHGSHFHHSFFQLTHPFFCLSYFSIDSFSYIFHLSYCVHHWLIVHFFSALIKFLCCLLLSVFGLLSAGCSVTVLYFAFPLCPRWTAYLRASFVPAHLKKSFVGIPLYGCVLICVKVLFDLVYMSFHTFLDLFFLREGSVCLYLFDYIGS